jgi:lipoprotein-releasing system permease protein
LRGYSKKDFSKLGIIKQENFTGNSNNLIDYNISIGKELSYNLNLQIGDKIIIMSPSGVGTIIGNLPKQQTFIVSSIFDSGLADFDQNIAFININSLENFFNLNKKNRNLEIYLRDPQNIEKMKIKIQ